jgi:hypothetical protein
MSKTLLLSDDAIQSVRSSKVENILLILRRFYISETERLDEFGNYKV